MTTEECVVTCVLFVCLFGGDLVRAFRSRR